MRILAVYDGSLDSPALLRYGLEKVKQQGARLIVLHVFHDAMFIDYDVPLSAKEISRRESFSCLDYAQKIISDSGENLRAKVAMEEGEPEEEIVRYAEDNNIDLILSPPRYRAVAKKTACRVSIVGEQASYSREMIPAKIIKGGLRCHNGREKIKKGATSAAEARAEVIEAGPS